jgi:hypothetical protein
VQVLYNETFFSSPSSLGVRTLTGQSEVRLRGVVDNLKQRVEVRQVGLVPHGKTGRHESVRNVRIGAQDQVGHYGTEGVSDEDHFLGLVLADGVVVVSKGSASFR